MTSPRSPRLFVEQPLAAGRGFTLSRDHSHYVATVMRLGRGDDIRLFNGADGEWTARLGARERKCFQVECIEQTRAQTAPGDLHYLFAPLKHARLDYMVQKATELGAARLMPVFTQYTIVTRVNEKRMHANAIEAAEQCNLLTVPEIAPPAKLAAALANWPEGRTLVYCDEDAPVTSPLETLASAKGPVFTVLIGPEGGFSPEERERLRALPQVVAISLGPRVMRADTAGAAALALVQAVRGDWR